MRQPRQFALASALGVACQPVAVKAELAVKSPLFGIVTPLDLSRAMSRQPRRYFAVQKFRRDKQPWRFRAPSFGWLAARASAYFAASFTALEDKNLASVVWATALAALQAVVAEATAPVGRV